MQNRQASGVIWSKGSESNGSGGNNCVEVAFLDNDTVGVRNSKDRSGPALAFTGAEWDAFISSVKKGEFDRRAGN